MPHDCISYRDSGYFSALICDYLEQKETVKPLYHRFPNPENFEIQIQEKQASFPKPSRKILTNALKTQYEGIAVSDITRKNIALLEDEQTFTITTGHQLNLFTGPLYFLYKIISAVNLCKQLKNRYPSYNFVPVYWMATEDHDFEEINHFNFKGKKIVWERESAGAVGELDTTGLDLVLEELKKHFGKSPNALQLQKLFEEAYLKTHDLSKATRILANALFSESGLVIVDGNSHELKKLFSPYIKNEILQQTSANCVAATNAQLGKNYGLQVNPREINMFYLPEGLRERIIKENGNYFVNNTKIQFTEKELLSVIEKHPERFSPNVILRPLYQEVILPNLCYIGGGGEIAYWLQLKTFFESQNVPFPILLLRNSVVLLSSKQQDKIKKLGLSTRDLFLPKNALENQVTRQISEIEIDFLQQRNHLKQQFKELYEIAKKTDPSFEKMVAAQETKQLKGLNAMEKRLLKAQKRKLADHLNRVTLLQDEIFPGGGLQERVANFSEFYLEFGDSLSAQLFETLDPLHLEFVCLELGN